MLTVMSAWAQPNNRAFDFNTWNDSTMTGKWGFNAEILTYARNTEYTTKLDKGKTLLGIQAIPMFSYRPFDSVQFTGGVYLKKDLGSDQFDRISPVFALQIRERGHEFTFGTLQGSTTHQLIEPLYHFEGLINKRMENGIQHRYHGKRIRSDFWIDWEKMIYQKSPYREEFTAGYSGEWYAIDWDKFKWSFPVQVLAHHRGGEIDASPLPVESQYNFAYGSRMRFPISDSKLKMIELQGYLTYYEDRSRIPADSFIDGLGQYVSLLFQAKHTGLMFHYWDAHQFQSPNGDPVFRSLSVRNPAYIFHYRKMISARLMYERMLFPDFLLSGRLHVMSDLHQGNQDFVLELYLRYRNLSELRKQFNR